MTYLRTAFIDGLVLQNLVDGDRPYDLAQTGAGELIVACREVRWPDATSYGDFDENGWLRLDPPDAVRA